MQICQIVKRQILFVNFFLNQFVMSVFINKEKEFMENRNSE